jgi:hypothetical protein
VCRKEGVGVVTSSDPKSDGKLEEIAVAIKKRGYLVQLCADVAQLCSELNKP